MADESSIDIAINIVNGDKKGYDDIQKQLEKSLEEAVDIGLVKKIKNSKEAISKLRVGDSFYIARYTQKQNGGIDKRFKRQYLGALTKSEMDKIYQSSSKKSIITQNEYSQAVKDVQDKRVDVERKKKESEALKNNAKLEKEISLEKARQQRIEQQQDIAENKLIAKKQESLDILNKESEERQKNRNLDSTWLSITGASDLEIKKQKLSDLKKEFYELGETGGEEFEKIKTQVIQLTSEIEKMQESARPTALQKLFNTIKRVGFYRIARNLFRFVESGLSEGLKGLAVSSPEVNKTMSSLVTNLQKISNSLVMVIYPVLKMIEPLLDWITKIVMQLAEGISYLAYQLGLTAHWFKVNEEYAKDFANQMNKFSFDKFEALSSDESNGKNPFTEMTGDGGSGEIKKLADEAQRLANIVGFLVSAFGLLVGVKFASWISASLPKIQLMILSMKEWIATLSTAQIVLGSLAISVGVFFVVDNLLKKAPKWVSVLTAVAGAIALIGVAIAFATGNIPKAVAIPIMMASAAVTIAGIKNTMSIPEYASGGMVDKGSLFVAGEAGAELVTTTPSGQTGVTNIAQFKQAMVEALYEWGGGFGGEQGAVVLNLDGAEIARSKRFTGEMNRRNAGLNLK